MANKVLLACLRQTTPMYARGIGSMADVQERIGNRDIVGHGYNGEATYLDRSDYPLPAIRFKPNTSDVMVMSLIIIYFFVKCDYF